MDRFDYNHAQNEHYLSTGIYGGDKSRPVAWGSTSSFNDPITIEVKRELVQLIVEPIVDVTTVLSFAGIVVRYLQNGVYTVALGEDVTRVVASTGPVSIKVVASNSEVYVVIDNVTVRLDVQAPAVFEMSISPTSGILYDKIIYNYAGSIDTLIRKDVRRVADSSGVLTPLSNDKWFEPKLIIADDMDRVDDYYVTSRGLTLANTAAAFYSDTDLIEKSVDAEEWLPVNKVEYHGEESLIFRSKDPSFAVRFFDTNVDKFIVAGATTTVTGTIYKVGDNIGSYFSHDCYRIDNGSIAVQATGMTSLTVLGYIGPLNGVNLLENPKFENGFDKYENIGSNLTIDQFGGRDGTPALRMDAGGVGISTGAIAVQAGQTWRWEVFYRTSDDLSGSIGMRPIRRDAIGESNVPGHQDLTISEDWRRLSFDWTVSGDWNEINMRFANSIETGTIWIDEVRLTNVTDIIPIEQGVQIDNSGSNDGKMHLYTFPATDILTIDSDEIYIAGIGVNLNHEDVMSHLTGVSQISYADEVHALQDGVTTNSDNEYAILDLQWNV